jgi:hypothetical protein
VPITAEKAENSAASLGQGVAGESAKNNYRWKAVSAITVAAWSEA